MRGLPSFGNPSRPSDVAAGGQPARQPNTQPTGYLTGAPPRTRLLQMLVTPITNALGVIQVPTLIVPETRGNRFIVLTAPFNNFAIFVNGDPNFNLLSSFSLPPGLPYEITLPGNQALYAVSSAPTFQPLRIQINEAIVGDTERRL